MFAPYVSCVSSDKDGEKSMGLEGMQLLTQDPSLGGPSSAA